MNKEVLNYDAKRLDAVTDIASLVATTAGPYGQNVEFIGGESPLMIRDGYKVLQKFSPADDLMLGLKFRMQEAAYRTVRAAGDGSTTTTILMRWIYENAIDWIHEQKAEENNSPFPVSRRDIANGIRHAGKICVEALENADKIDITTDKGKSLLRMVATLAGSNDAQIGNAIAEIIIAIGKDGYVMTEYDPNIKEMSYEIKSGYTMPYGLIHNTMLPRGRKDITIQDAYVAVCKDLISTVDTLRPIIMAWKEYCQREQSIFPLVLIVPGIDADAMATILNRSMTEDRKGWENPIWSLLPGIRLPWFCVKVQAVNEVWEDIEAITGAKVFSSRENRSVKYFKPDSGIVMPSIVLSMEQSVLHINTEALETSGIVSRLKESLEGAEDRQALESRIARLEGRVGVVRIPVHSQAKRSWTAEVFEDAYLAAISAIEKGIVPGAGKKLISLGEKVGATRFKAVSPSYAAGLAAVGASLSNIFRTLLENGGVPVNRIEGIVNVLSQKDDWSTISLNDSMLSNLCGEVPIQAMLEDGRKTGVIDSAAAVSAAISSACEEVADWVETSKCVVPASYRG
jgi:chaperonin GroEL